MAGIKQLIATCALIIFSSTTYAQITSGRIVYERRVNLLSLYKDNDRVKLLNTVVGLAELVLQYYPKATGKHKALLMEFVLYGLSAYSLISKKILSEKIEFRDLMGSMFSGEDEG